MKEAQRAFELAAAYAVASDVEKAELAVEAAAVVVQESVV